MLGLVVSLMERRAGAVTFFNNGINEVEITGIEPKRSVWDNYPREYRLWKRNGRPISSEFFLVTKPGRCTCTTSRDGGAGPAMHSQRLTKARGTYACY